MTDTASAETVDRQPRITPMRRIVSSLTRQPLVLVAIAWLAFTLVVSFLAPWVAPYDPNLNDFTSVLQGPSSEHLLGTDENGRDVLSRILFGARIALLVGVGSACIAAAIGIPIGLLLGYRGGWTDRIGTRLVDVADALPGMITAFAVVAIFGRGLFQVMFAIGLMFSMAIVRMSRAITLAERAKAYVDAARVGGLRQMTIIFNQVLPNLAGPLIIHMSILMGAAITIEAALSFLAIGLDPTVPSWGGLLGVAVTKQALQPFMIFPPGIAIILTVVSLNLLGDGFSQALGPAQRAPVARSERESLAQRPQDAVADTTPPDAGTVLDVRSLSVGLTSGARPLNLLNDVSLSIKQAEIMGVIGESGSGKSTLARAALGLLQPGLAVTNGSLWIGGDNLTYSSLGEWRQTCWGKKIAAVFQDPAAALSPVNTVGAQLRAPIQAHRPMSRHEANVIAADLLTRVGVQDAANRLGDYPHQFSGGMAQRVSIAMALATQPDLLIADEPTSSLDVTTQSQVLDLLLSLRDEFNMAIMLITHDLGVVAEACDRVAVMHRGRIVEIAEVNALFDNPQHPYTKELLGAFSRMHGRSLPKSPHAPSNAQSAKEFDT